MADERPRFALPTQEQVAYRALCLHAVVIRGELEYSFQLCRNLPAQELQGLQQRVDLLLEWLSREGLRPHLSPIERDYWFSEPLGQWEQQATLDASWRKTSLGVLLWALSLLPALPAYDAEVPEKLHLEMIGWLQPVAPFLARVRLRPQEEIDRARDVAELWHWRAYTTRIQREQPRVAKQHDLPRVIRQAAELAHRRGDIPPPIGHDFPAFGKPYARLSDQEYSLAMSIAMERHFALNWLCGYSANWDSTPTDT